MERSSTDEKITMNQKTLKSKAAIAAFILGIASIFLFPLTYLATIVLSIIAFVKIKRSRGELKGKWFAVSGLIIPVLVLIPILIIWSQDAGPVPDDFTESDLLHVKPENEAGYEALLKLCDARYGTDENSAIGFNRQDEELLSSLNSKIRDREISIEEVFVRVSENRETIELLWNKAKRGREVIQRLAEYDEVAELTDCNTDPWPDYQMNLYNLDKLSCLYALSEVQQGNGEITLNEFMAINKVVRRLSTTSRGMLTKMTCLGSIICNLDSAELMLNRTDIPKELIETIEIHFQPINHQHVSLKNNIISEYLTIKSLQSKAVTEHSDAMPPVLKINSMNRFLYTFSKNAILKDEGRKASECCELSVWPWKYNWPKLYFQGDKVREQFSKNSLYFYYNPVGTLLLTLWNDNMFSDSEFQRSMQIRVKDDLFQWVLARRMGEEGSLKARAYSDEYTVDVDKGLVFSVGPDGEPYTKDDIKLRIDPVVLGLK